MFWFKTPGIVFLEISITTQDRLFRDQIGVISALLVLFCVTNCITIKNTAGNLKQPIQKIALVENNHSCILLANQSISLI